MDGTDIDMISRQFQLQVKLELEHSRHTIRINKYQFQQIILEALGALFGEVGKALLLTVHNYNESTKEATVETTSPSDKKKLWSALTLFGIYAGQNCAFRVSDQTGDGKT